MSYKPPFEITPKTLSLCLEISHQLGRYEGLSRPKLSPKQIRENKIKTLQGSLAIDGNILPPEKILALLSKKKVEASKKEILEAANALKIYDHIDLFDPTSSKSLLKAHQVLMKGLLPDGGHWRKTDNRVSPKAERVPLLMEDLFDFLKQDKDTPVFIKACAFHYELEFIHPFTQGNGFIGRFWQHLILMKENPIFEFIPIDAIIKKHQRQYHEELHKADRIGSSSTFIEFCLGAVATGLQEFFEEIKKKKARK